MNIRTIGLLTGAGVSRREMLGTLARWTVPTVLTLTLATRRAAAASCPPCTKRTGGRCRACTMNQILNCQCEPCLGAPYCSGGAAVIQPSVSGGLIQAAPGGAPGAAGSGPVLSPYFGRGLTSPGANPFQSPIQRSPFSSVPYGASRPYGLPRDSLPGRSRTLYDRLRADQRRPF
jgi:hypothetical protein